MEPRLAHEVSISDLFDQFVEASTMRNVLSIFHRILNYAQLSPCEFNQFFPKLKQSVLAGSLKKNWKAKALFSKLDKRAAHRCYSNTRSPSSRASCGEDRNSFHDTALNNNALEHYKCLVIGSGPAGLRTAIELQLLGASKVVVVEKRGRFSRNNVVHLWPFVIDDLKSLGAKKFYGKFCAGSIDHISIRQLQLILLKISLMLGCDFRDSCSYLHLCPSSLLSPASHLESRSGQKENKSDTEKANSFSDISQQQQQVCTLLGTEQACLLDYARVNSSSSPQVDTGAPDLCPPSVLKDPQQTTNRSTEKLSSSLNNLQELKYISGNAYLNLLQQPLNDVKSLDNYTTSNGVTSLAPPTTGRCQQEQQQQQQQHQKTVIESDKLRGIRAHFECDHQLQERELHGIEWDIIIGADGRRNTMGKFFPRKEFRGRLAIAITANFFNRQTPAEASVSEISGLSFIYNQDMFNSLTYDTNIQLENICYYKDDTHYFVMTAKKKSLLERGVLIQDYATTQDLLSDSNVNREALLKYAKDAAHWTTGLEPLDFALNHYGQEDCAMFDFTSMHASLNACKAIPTSTGGLALLGLVGDSLLEPFWPTGSGCARGFLSSFDAAWMCRQWAINKCAVVDLQAHTCAPLTRNSCARNRSPGSYVTPTKRNQPTPNNRMALNVLAERESIYRILAQTTSENLHQNYSHWTLNPHTRYPNLNRHHVVPSQVEHLLSGSGQLLEVPPPTTTAKRPVGGSKLVPNGRGTERARRIKSPPNVDSSSRKSPKKLKSVTVSPFNQQQQQQSNRPSKYKSTTKSTLTKTSVQRQIRMLYDRELDSSNGFDADPQTQYNNWELDYFDVSVSGTLPSTNNLQSLEARRARDIDECLRQRRQKSQLHAVKDQLIGKFRSGEGATLAGAAISQELRRLREQRSSIAATTGTMLIAGKENRPGRAVRDANNSLSLLNSIRRCASFAERVRSFEEKLSTSGRQPETTPATPKLALDKVQNLPNFAALHGLFVDSTSAHNKASCPKKSKIPILKLSKQDWNVKCWEDRLLKEDNNRRASQQQQQLGGSMMSLNRAAQMQQVARPEKQVELFRGRIKEMAEKLRIVADEPALKAGSRPAEKVASERPVGGWVNHLKKELIKGVESRRYPDLDRQNSTPLRKPVKKLFENDDDGDHRDDLDMSKHYDHLCVNRPTNKYLSKGAYTSHLARIKYNSATSRTVNTKQPESASRAAYLNSMLPVSPGSSSASSSLSDYSSNTSGASGNSNNNKSAGGVSCFRCGNRLRAAADGITIAGASFHSSCLTCSRCALSLRKCEMRHYVNSAPTDSSRAAPHEKRDFLCSICDPSMPAAGGGQGLAGQDGSQVNGSGRGAPGTNYTPAVQQQASREEFLNRTINYNELYKNILAAGSNSFSAAAAAPAARSDKIECLMKNSSTNNNTAAAADATNNKSIDLKFDDASRIPAKVTDESAGSVSSSVTPPARDDVVAHTMKPTDATCHRAGRSRLDYGVAEGERLRVSGYSGLRKEPTETAPGPGKGCSSRAPMIDEDELELMMKVGNGYVAACGEPTSAAAHRPSSAEVAKEDTDDDDDDDSLTGSERAANAKGQAGVSEATSSLSSSVDYSASATENEEEEDDDDEQLDHNESTYDDFLTSEEFGAPSDNHQHDQSRQPAPPPVAAPSSPDKLHKVSA